MARGNTAANFKVSGDFSIKKIGKLTVWEKRTFPTVNGVSGDMVKTYHVTRDKSVESFHGSRIETQVVSENFSTPEKAIETAEGLKQ